jgi:Bacteriophage Mu Gam like protein
MTVTRTSDNREFQSATVTEADKKFEQLAQLEIAIKAKKAVAEKRIADVKSKLIVVTEAAVDEYNGLIKWIDAYILANKKRFIKPRQRRTEFGKYGLRTATKLHIQDADKVIQYAEGAKLPLFTVKKIVDKKQVEKHLAEGHTVPGAKMISGDVAGFKVSKELLEAELKR